MRAQLRVGVHTTTGVVQVGVSLLVEAAILGGAELVERARRGVLGMFGSKCSLGN
jgi:hypothetical protein